MMPTVVKIATTEQAIIETLHDGLRGLPGTEVGGHTGCG